MNTTTTRTEPTREQDAAAEALALEWDSVEVRPLEHGIVSCICRTPYEDRDEGEHTRIVHLNEDGDPLSLDEFRTYKMRFAAEAKRIMREADAYDRTTHVEVLNALRDVARRAEAGYPQYDGVFDEVGLAHASQRLTTKGGVAWERDDFALLTERDGPGGRAYGEWSAYSFRRMVFVSTSAGYIRALLQPAAWDGSGS